MLGQRNSNFALIFEFTSSYYAIPSSSTNDLMTSRLQKSNMMGRYLRACWLAGIQPHKLSVGGCEHQDMFW